MDSWRNGPVCRWFPPAKIKAMGLPMMLKLRFSLAVCFIACAVDAVFAETIPLVVDGASRAVIVAASDAEIAAERLQTFFSVETGAKIQIMAADHPVPADRTRIVLCTMQSRNQVNELISERAFKSAIKPE